MNMFEKIEKEENAKEQPQNTAGVTPSFKVVKATLLYKEYSSREEVLEVSANMARVAKEKYDDKTAKIYAEAYERLSWLTYEQMCEIKRMVTPIKEEDVK